MHPSLTQAKRIVVKIGTQIMMGDDGTLAEARLAGFVRQCATLLADGKDVLIVTSGAVGLGRRILNLPNGKLTLTEKQACASVGQNLLMDVYRGMFKEYDRVTAQLLLTAHDFSDRQRYLNLRETLEKLLALNAVPIINENDTVSASELQEDKTKSFGDNDKLSALVASKLGADLLIILTNVDGIYSENPLDNPEAQRFSVIEGFEQLRDIVTRGKSAYGRGGMATKIEAAKIAALSGVNTVIASGLRENVIADVLASADGFGTLILAKTPLSERKRWLGLASGYNGIVVVNAGARQALMERHASLLPSGIVQVQGEFLARQVVSIQDETGEEIGRGLANFSAEDMRRIQGRQSKELQSILGDVEGDEAIHRDNLVIYEEATL